LLAEQDLKTRLYDLKFEDNLLKCRDNRIKKIDNYGSTVYDKLQKSCSNDLKNYKKEFKRKYSKRKDLIRLDCYCEKNIFDMIDRIGEQQVGTSRYNIKLKKV
ncbi:CYIR protein, partial [Plasmodium cynomolgi strain B]